MSVKVSRRDGLQFIGLGALALGHASLFVGCANGEGASARKRLSATQPSYKVDPDRPWWVQPPFEPVNPDARG